MANYEGFFRSNHFKVKDPAAFKQWAGRRKLQVYHSNKIPGAFTIVSATDDGGCPSIDLDTGEGFDIIPEIAKHLQSGEIAVLMEIGREKTAYIGAWAVAIDHTGDRVNVDLGDIYDKARKHFGVEDITFVQY